MPKEAGLKEWQAAGVLESRGFWLSQDLKSGRVGNHLARGLFSQPGTPAQRGRPRCILTSTSNLLG